MTARVQAGRALRDELQRINRLQGKGKSADAAAALEALNASAPSSEQARNRESESLKDAKAVCWPVDLETTTNLS